MKVMVNLKRQSYSRERISKKIQQRLKPKALTLIKKKIVHRNAPTTNHNNNPYIDPDIVNTSSNPNNNLNNNPNSNHNNNCCIARYTDVWNRHWESKNTKLYEIGSDTNLLFTFLSLKDSTWGERDTIVLCWLLLHLQLSTLPKRGACSAQSRLASLSSDSQLSSSETGTQLTAFC